MSHNLPMDAHPYGPGMEHVRMKEATPVPVDYGLGIWGTLAMIGGTTAAQWISGRGNGDIPDEIYYPEAKLGVVHCAGPWNIEALSRAIERSPAGDPVAAQIRPYFVSGVTQRGAEKWAQWGLPFTPTEQAGALVAEAHGGSDCQRGPDSTAASALIRRLLSADEERQRTFAGQAQGAVTAVARVLPEVIPGVSTPLLLAAAGAAAFLLWRR